MQMPLESVQGRHHTKGYSFVSFLARRLVDARCRLLWAGGVSLHLSSHCLQFYDKYTIHTSEKYNKNRSLAHNLCGYFPSLWTANVVAI
jgi:hypothetical protein